MQNLICSDYKKRELQGLSFILFGGDDYMDVGGRATQEQLPRGAAHALSLRPSLASRDTSTSVYVVPVLRSTCTSMCIGIRINISRVQIHVPDKT